MINEKNMSSLTLKENISCVAAFVKACWRTLLCILSVVLVPMCLIQALCEDVFVSTVSSHVAKEDMIIFGIDTLWTIMMSFFSDIYIIIVVYGMMKIYHRQDVDGNITQRGFNDITIKNFWTNSEVPVHAVGKTIASMVLFVAILVGLSFAIGVAGGMLTSVANGNDKMLVVVVVLFAVLLLLAIPLWVLVVPAYSLDEQGFVTGIKKTVVYGFATWRGVVALLTVYLFVSIVAVSPFGFIPGFVGSFIGCYVGYIVQAAALVALGYQYWHAKAKELDITVAL